MTFHKKDRIDTEEKSKEIAPRGYFPVRPLPLLFSLILGCLLTLSLGCGIREPQSGSLKGRVITTDGAVVPKAQVYSLFNEIEKVLTSNDGSFYLSELPAGRNRIVILHKDYKMEERMVNIPPSTYVTIDPIRLDRATTTQAISNSRVEFTASTTATIGWTTYKPLAGWVEYGLDQSYGTIVQEREEVTDHLLTISGLTPETVYHARIKFSDETGIVRFSYDLPFKTTAGDSPYPVPLVNLKPLKSYGIVSVEWSPSTSTSVVGYRVDRREIGGNWQQLNNLDLDKSTLSFDDQTAKGGHFYEYAVTAVSVNAAISSKVISKKIFMPGFIGETLTITASESPIFLYSDLIVQPSVNFYVNEGVEFRVASMDSFRIGEDPDRVEILVIGRISISGSASSPVRFTPLDGVGSRDHWGGIRIKNSGTGNSEIKFSEFFGCKDQAIFVDTLPAVISGISVSHSQGGVYFSGIRNSPTFSDCSFKDISSMAVTVKGCRRFEMTNSEVSDSGGGFSFITENSDDKVSLRETLIETRNIGIKGTFSRSIIANCLIQVPSGVAVEYLSAQGAENFLDHCTLNAKTGVQIASGLPVIENNIITALSEKGASGIKYLAGITPEFSYNNVFGFAISYDNCKPGFGAKSLNPGFVGGNPYDFHLFRPNLLSTADRNGQEMGRYGKSYK